MSYYEDLGVPADATPEQIRDSYRMLARLLHPDQQTDAALRATAEIQMRRINQRYGVLSDPEKRRRYDDEMLGAEERAAPIVIHAPRPLKRPGVSWGAMTWTAAALASCGAIYWLGSQGQPLAAREEAPSYPPAASAGKPAMPAGFGGSWVYRSLGSPNTNSPKAETGDEPAGAPAEVIETTIEERSGELSGTYRARYRDQTVTPDVKFDFEGAAAGSYARLRWKGTGGATGEMRLRLLPMNRMEVNWVATGGMGLPGTMNGAAVLSRRPDGRAELR